MNEIKGADVATGELVEITGVHPVADLFPMLDPAELGDLAASIAERGQRIPIVLDVDGRILDGRNRLAACQQADVVPLVTVYEGDDPDGEALNLNGQRRDLTKSKRAIIAAQAESIEPIQFGDQVRIARAMQVSKQLVNHAAAIVKFAPDLIAGIFTGEPFEAAYKTALERKRGKETREKRLAKIREDAPDLYDRIIAEDDALDLDEAEAIQQAKVNNAKSAARSLTTDLGNLTDLGPRLRTIKFASLDLAYANGERPPNLKEIRDILADLDRTKAHLGAIAEHLERTANA